MVESVFSSHFYLEFFLLWVREIFSYNFIKKLSIVFDFISASSYSSTPWILSFDLFNVFQTFKKYHLRSWIFPCMCLSLLVSLLSPPSLKLFSEWTSVSGAFCCLLFDWLCWFLCVSFLFYWDGSSWDSRLSMHTLTTTPTKGIHHSLVKFEYEINLLNPPPCTRKTFCLHSGKARKGWGE